MVDYEFSIGKKATLVYVGIILAKIVPEGQDFLIKARWKSINKAVDVALISCSKLKNIKIKNIEVGTQEIQNIKKQMITLSTIEILLGE